MKIEQIAEINASNVLNHLKAGKTYIVDASNGDIYEADKATYYSWHTPEYRDDERQSWPLITMKNEVRGWGEKRVMIWGLNKTPLPVKRHEMSRHIFYSTTIQENCPIFTFRDFADFLKYF